ncbi:MAG: multidrug efflux RND transporter permease subunit [Pseudomonadota bacterium]
MLSQFFISRPIFASVIALVTTLAGLISIPQLPVGEFPEVVPPTVAVSASYTGGSAEVVEQAVTIPLEEQINGVQGMVYMSSTSSNDGTSNIAITFEEGYDLDIAAVDTQNRVATAMAQLPAEVIAAGVTVTKAASDLTLAVNLISPDGRFDGLFISNYADIHITDRLKRIPGVGEVMAWGERIYAMRIWLDPEKLASLGLTAADVRQAVLDQNKQVAAGALGAPPTSADQKFQITLTAKGRLKSPEEFENIIVATGDLGAVVRLKDVARVELGAEDYSFTSKLNTSDTVGLGIMQLPGANALNLSAEVRAIMAELSKDFPEGLEYDVLYDTTNFDRAAIRDVLFTLGQAILLVVFVIIVFLPNLRAALVPVITIPVCLIGTFAMMLALGFSINLLTLFGLVLAVGLVVDDAIVVVENVSRHIENGETDAREAARRAMNEVTGPIVATSLVLMAVFIPIALMPGLTGKLYQQFALTIASAVAISAINALTLSPALCGVLLGGSGSKAKLIQRFDAGFAWFTRKYEATVGWFIRLWPLVTLGFAGLLAGTVYMFTVVPTGFIPNEDQGYFIISVETPEGTALGQTQKVVDKAYDILDKLPGVEGVVSFAGFSALTNTDAPNQGNLFAVLKSWDERSKAGEDVASLISDAQSQFNEMPDGIIASFNPPPIFGLSPTGGFQFELQDTTGGALTDLQQVTEDLVAAGNARPELVGLYSPFSASTPQLEIEVDRTRALTDGVALQDIFDALQTFMGGYYVNDFNIYGRVYKVYLQADLSARRFEDDIGRLYVRNDSDEMVPLSALVTIKPEIGARTINHYNLFRSTTINGAAAAGYSSSQAITAMEELAQQILPTGYTFEWTGNAYQEIKAGNVAPILFALAVVFAFLFLAAQYESFLMPFMVLLAVPLAIFGALVAQWYRGYDNNVYCQIGLVMLIGLASKGAILIVEFARKRREEGLSIEESAMEAARIRIRPLLMTAFAFILGVLPLVLASGAGSAARRSLGTAVFGGMIVATILSLVLVPVLYVVLERLREWFSKGRSKELPTE